MSFNNLRNSFEKVLHSNGKGFRAISTIDKNCIHLVKNFLQIGDHVKHIKYIFPISFEVSQTEVAITVEKMEGGKRSKKFLISNEPLYVNHFNTIFEELWNKGIDATRRIKDIEEGFEIENVEIIPDPAQSIELAKNLIKDSKNEIILLFPSYSGLSRMIIIGVMKILNEVSEINKINRSLA